MSTRIIPPSRRRLAPLLFGAALVCAVTWFLVSTWRTDEYISVGGNTMGGTWSVKLRNPSRWTPGEKFRRRLQARLIVTERGLTSYGAGSQVSALVNGHRGTDWIDVSSDLAEVVARAAEVSEQTGGAFDITVAPLVNLWGFGPRAGGVRTGNIPSDDAIAAARAHVGYRKLHVRTSPPALQKDDPELEIDLGAIGKGYAAGQLAADLDARGVTDYLIAVGGELRAKGVGPDGRPWPVGIEVPAPDTRRVLRTLELRDAGLSTSGDYRNFVEIAGQRFSHEIDPRTGRPVTGNLASVSVVHPDSAYADALATGLMVLGAEDGFALAERLHLAALFVLRGEGRFETRATPEFERLTISNPLR